MNCQQTRKYLINYSDGNVSPHLKLQLEQHLQVCESCRNNYKLTMIENEVLREPIEIPALSDSFTSRIMESIAPASCSSPPPSSDVSKKWAGWTLIACAAVLLVFLGSRYFPLVFPAEKVKVADNQSISENKQKELSIKKATDKTASSAPFNEASEQSVSKELASPVINHKKSVIRNESGTLSAPGTSIQAGNSSGASCTASTDAQYDQNSSGVRVIVPGNLPEGFQMESFSQNNQETIFTYSKDNELLEIRIVLSGSSESTGQVPSIAASIEPYTKTNDQSFADSGFKQSVRLMAESSAAAGTVSDNPLSSLSMEKNIDDSVIQITFNSNLPAEELSNLAKQITFAESDNVKP